MEGANHEVIPIERHPSREALKPELAILPWRDEVIETLGYSARSMYVEMRWLPVLGPTATWLYRRLGTWVETNPEGVTVDLSDLTVSIGLCEGLGPNSLMARALHRLTRFDVARWEPGALQVRRALPPLPVRHARKLSYTVYRYHEACTQHPHGHGYGTS